ncbi:hypothetical protein [Magnetospirillum sp. SS-4]|uniref:hypothetical protein n=1 Tax=Magnetospirillum sp. SS-4 TaxID=2681465 RepID=UPI0013855530|nr:hypothetical protein [Magnetospirillum sp. SS-4]CAA7621808.1 hypothetical protein MTBSS4_300047 [Magnetospirillum sp. SS-4]
MAYLTRKPSGRYHVRVRVPLDLVPRRLIPSWRAQGMLLAAVAVAAEPERERRAAEAAGEAGEGGAIESVPTGDDEAWVGPSDDDLAAAEAFGGWGP